MSVVGHRGRLIGAGLAALLAVCGGVLVLPGEAHADSSYEAIARTEVFTGTMANESIPTGIDIEGGGPQASVKQNSVGVADASAQLPYAGDTVPGLPGTGGALFNFPVPPYPFIASTTAGTAPRTVSYPGVTLHAESGDFVSEATSTAGQPGAGATALAKVVESRSGDVTATSSTLADTVTLGPYLTLSDVRSVVTVAADGITGKLTKTSHSSIGRISLPVLNIEIPKENPSQIPIPVPIPGVPNQAPLEIPVFPYPSGGSTLHDPAIGIQDGHFTITEIQGGKEQTYLIPSGPVLDAFAAQGVTIKFQAPQETKNGLAAGAYIFEYTAPAPPQNTYWNGPTKFTQRTSYALASVDLKPVQAPAVGTAPVITGGQPPVLPADAVPAEVGPPALPEAIAPVDTAVAPVPVPQDSALPTRGLIVAAPAASAVAVQVGEGVDGVYLALAGLALLGGLSVVGVRVLGA